MEAVRSLQHIGGAEAEKLLKKAEQDHYPKVRTAAALALSKLKVGKQ